MPDPAPSDPAPPVVDPAVNPPADPAAPPPASWDAQVWDAAAPGKLIPDWHTKAPDPAKLEPYKGAKSFDELVTLAEKRVSDAQAALRARPAGSAPRPTGDGVTPQQLDAWRSSVGLPLKPEDYPIAKPPGIAAEVWDDAEVKAFAQFAHENDLAPSVVQKSLEWFHSRTQDRVAAANQASATNAQAFQKWETETLGKAFGDRLDSTVKDMKELATVYKQDAEIFDPQSPKFWGAEALVLFSALAARVPRGEDGTLRSMGAPTPTGQYDKAWAKAVLNPAHQDHEAFINPKHPNHARIHELRNQAYAHG